MITNAATAVTLYVSATQGDIGKNCFGPTTTSGDYLLGYCNDGGLGVLIDFSYTHDGGTNSSTICSEIQSPYAEACTLTYSQREAYFCDLMGETVCNWCFNINDSDMHLDSIDGDIQHYSKYGDWTTLNSARNSVSRQITSVDMQDKHESCILVPRGTTTQYGCRGGYYATSGVGTANITCAPCPDGGTSFVGNTAQTGCYLNVGAFGDATGSGRVTGTCWWR